MPCVYYALVVASRRMRNNSEFAATGYSESKEAIFFGGMVWILEGQSERVTEDRSGFVEGNPMLFRIGSRLVSVPFKPHAVSLSDTAYWRLTPHDAPAQTLAGACKSPA